MSAHEEAQRYWRTASATFVADAAYYSSVRLALRQHVIPRVPAGATVLDVGCGDGTFTEELASVATSVLALDLSPSLIDTARQRSLGNVEFRVADASTLTSTEQFDVVSCMGVLVCLVDDNVFKSTLEITAGAVRPGGLLVLRETLCGWGRRVVRHGDSVACYRSRHAYLSALSSFDLVVDDRLVTWSRLMRRSNHLLLLRRRA